MKRLAQCLQYVPLAVTLLVLPACTTPPDKPHTPQQQPHVQPPPPPPPPQEMESRTEQQQSSAGATGETQRQTELTETAPPPPEQAQSAPPPSAETTDVEITDIPVDEHGNPIIEPKPPASPSAQTRNSTSQPAGGGAATPPDGQREAASSGSSGRDSPIAGAEGGPVVNVGAMTEAERVAALEQDLDGKLAKFDELMRRAREDAKREQAAGGGGGYAGAPDGKGARAAPPQNGRGAGGQADTSSGRGNTPDFTGNGEGQYKYAGTGPTPQDIQDTRDDDIVARQLREAATGESDPVLREKLWDEYRKYKKGTGRR